MSNIIDQLPEDIRKELFVDTDGKTYASLRAIARLAGVSLSALIDPRLGSKGRPRGILHQIKWTPQENPALPDYLKPFAGMDYKVTARAGSNRRYFLPDIWVASIIKYFAFDAEQKYPEAIKCDLAFSAIGVRALFQQLLGWQPQPKGRPKQIEKWRKDGKSDEWIQERIEGIDYGRKTYVKEVLDRKGSQKTVAQGTNVVYSNITGKNAAELKSSLATRNPRNELDQYELMAIKFAETNAAKRMKKYDASGHIELIEQTEQAAVGVRMLMDDCT